MGLGVLIGGIASGVGSIIGGGAQASAAERAGQAQAAAIDRQIAAQKEALTRQLTAQKDARIQQEKLFGQGLELARGQYAQAREDLAPIREAQVGGVERLAQFSQGDSPYFQQQRAAQTQAIQRQLAAQGLLRSKRQGDLLTDLELGLSGQQLQANQALSQLQGAQGQAALSQGLGGVEFQGGQALGGIAGQYGANVANLYGQHGQQLSSAFGAQGQATAEQEIAQGQATAGMWQGIGNAVQGTIGNVMLENYLDKIPASKVDGVLAPSLGLGTSTGTRFSTNTLLAPRR